MHPRRISAVTFLTLLSLAIANTAEYGLSTGDVEWEECALLGRSWLGLVILLWLFFLGSLVDYKLDDRVSVAGRVRLSNLVFLLAALICSCVTTHENLRSCTMLSGTAYTLHEANLPVLIIIALLYAWETLVDEDDALQGFRYFLGFCTAAVFFGDVFVAAFMDRSSELWTTECNLQWIYLACMPAFLFVNVAFPMFVSAMTDDEGAYRWLALGGCTLGTLAYTICANVWVASTAGQSCGDPTLRPMVIANCALVYFLVPFFTYEFTIGFDWRDCRCCGVHEWWLSELELGLGDLPDLSWCCERSAAVAAPVRPRPKVAEAAGGGGGGGKMALISSPVEPDPERDPVFCAIPDSHMATEFRSSALFQLLSPQAAAAIFKPITNSRRYLTRDTLAEEGRLATRLIMFARSEDEVEYREDLFCGCEETLLGFRPYGDVMLAVSPLAYHKRTFTMVDSSLSWELKMSDIARLWRECPSALYELLWIYSLLPPRPLELAAEDKGKGRRLGGARKALGRLGIGGGGGGDAAAAGEERKEGGVQLVIVEPKEADKEGKGEEGGQEEDDHDDEDEAEEEGSKRRGPAAGAEVEAVRSADLPLELSESVAYYEAKIRVYKSAEFAVGLAFKDHKSSLLPGYGPHSYGWHLFAGEVWANGARHEMPLAISDGAEYTFGCGWDTEKHLIFFTVDGKLAPLYLRNVPLASLRIHISVLHSEKLERRVTVNLGQEPLAFKGLRAPSLALCTIGKGKDEAPLTEEKKGDQNAKPEKKGDESVVPEKREEVPKDGSERKGDGEKAVVAPVPPVELLFRHEPLPNFPSGWQEQVFRGDWTHLALISATMKGPVVEKAFAAEIEGWEALEAKQRTHAKLEGANKQVQDVAEKGRGGKASEGRGKLSALKTALAKQEPVTSWPKKLKRVEAQAVQLEDHLRKIVNTVVGRFIPKRGDGDVKKQRRDEQLVLKHCQRIFNGLQQEVSGLHSLTLNGESLLELILLSPFGSEESYRLLTREAAAGLRAQEGGISTAAADIIRDWLADRKATRVGSGGQLLAIFQALMEDLVLDEQRPLWLRSEIATLVDSQFDACRRSLNRLKWRKRQEGLKVHEGSDLVSVIKNWLIFLLKFALGVAFFPVSSLWYRAREITFRAFYRSLFGAAIYYTALASLIVHFTLVSSEAREYLSAMEAVIPFMFFVEIAVSVTLTRQLQSPTDRFSDDISAGYLSILQSRGLQGAELSELDSDEKDQDEEDEQLLREEEEAAKDTSGNEEAKKTENIKRILEPEETTRDWVIRLLVYPLLAAGHAFIPVIYRDYRDLPLFGNDGDMHAHFVVLAHTIFSFFSVWMLLTVMDDVLTYYSQIDTSLRRLSAFAEPGRALREGLTYCCQLDKRANIVFWLILRRMIRQRHTTYRNSRIHTSLGVTLGPFLLMAAGMVLALFLQIVAFKTTYSVFNALALYDGVIFSAMVILLILKLASINYYFKHTHLQILEQSRFAIVVDASDERQSRGGPASDRRASVSSLPDEEKVTAEAKSPLNRRASMASYGMTNGESELTTIDSVRDSADLLEAAVDQLKGVEEPIKLFGLVVDKAFLLQVGSFLATGVGSGLVQIIGWV